MYMIESLHLEVRVKWLREKGREGGTYMYMQLYVHLLSVTMSVYFL